MQTKKGAGQMLTAADLAERWQVPVRTLGQWRYEGRGPSYVKIGGAVRYRVSDVEAFEAEHLVAGGAE